MDQEQALSRQTAGTVTALLRRWRDGDGQAVDELAEVVYPELRQLARGRLLSQQHAGVSPTELVHEVYLRLAMQAQPEWANRAHFYYIASRLMRQVLVDFARERNAVKRGQGRRSTRLERVDEMVRNGDEDLLALHDALDRLARIDERKSKILEMRYFGGMTADEIAEVLGVAAVTVTREIRAARAWLRVALTES